jgi:DNA-binding NarL/FixJ family response regulator
MNGRGTALGIVWVDTPYPVLAAGFERSLRGKARVHHEPTPPAEQPIAAILDATDGRDVVAGVRRLKREGSGVSVLVFALAVDLPLAQSAIRAGAQGFIHAGMQPDQIARAVEVVGKGEIVAPRQLLEYLIHNDAPVGADILTTRQNDIMELVMEGLSNAQIAKRLYLSESTIKQHLRAAYKALGASNRAEAGRILRAARVHSVSHAE